MIVTGLGKLFVQYGNGGIIPVGTTSDSASFRLVPGEYVIPQGALKNFYTTTVSASGCFSGSFQFQDAPVPDADGWEPRAKWDRA